MGCSASEPLTALGTDPTAPGPILRSYDPCPQIETMITRLVRQTLNGLPSDLVPDEVPEYIRNVVDLCNDFPATLK